MIRKEFDFALKDGPFSYIDYGFNAYNFIIQHNDIFSGELVGCQCDKVTVTLIN